MPCHKLFLNLQWLVPQELKNLDIEIVTITKIYWTFREKVIRVCFFGIQFNRSHPLPLKKPQPNSTYTFTHNQKVSRTCTKCWATMLWTTRIHYWKNCCALCPASKRFLSKNPLTSLWANHSLTLNSNCTHTLCFFCFQSVQPIHLQKNSCLCKCFIYFFS